MPSDGTKVSTAETTPDEVRVTVDRVGAQLQYTIRVGPGRESERLWVVVGNAEILATSGFERGHSERGTRLKWAGNGTGHLVVAVEPPRDGTPKGATDGRESVATDEWTFARVPFVEVQRVADSTLTRSWPLTGTETDLADETGVFGDRYALAGPTTVVTRSVAGRTVRVVRPADSTPREDPEAIADALVEAGTMLDVGDRGNDVLAFAVPGVRRGGESVPARDEFWVNAEARLDSPENVWFHEYVHTRQSFDLATDMRWFREASAEYYAARLTAEQGRISDRELHAHFDGAPSAATLSDPATWESRQVPRQKGGRVLALLDGRIRAETHGHRSLQDVFRRLNNHDGPVTYAVFSQTVAEVSGTPMDDWLDRHVARNATVAASSPNSPGFTAAGLLAFERNPTPVFFVSVAFFLSLVAAVPLYRVLARLESRDRPSALRG